MEYNDKTKNKIKNSEFRAELEQLILITRKLKTNGLVTFMLTISGILSLAVSVLTHQWARNRIEKNYYSRQEYEQIDLFVWILSIGIILLGIYHLFIFNKNKKTGGIIYDELTDELDWSNKRKEFMRSPPIETRIVIKDFLQNTDLPFTNSHNGQTIYLIFFFILMIATIFIQIS